jgi:hypothetical protein
MIGAVEANRWHCPPPSVKSEIDVDLQFGRPFSDQYQEDEQHQEMH